jgi:hypothetical protein
MYSVYYFTYFAYYSAYVPYSAHYSAYYFAYFAHFAYIFAYYTYLFAYKTAICAYFAYCAYAIFWTFCIFSYSESNQANCRYWVILIASILWLKQRLQEQDWLRQPYRLVPPGVMSSESSSDSANSSSYSFPTRRYNGVLRNSKNIFRTWLTCQKVLSLCHGQVTAAQFDFQLSRQHFHPRQHSPVSC